MSTDTIVRMCAPTLAGMKTGSLFSQEFSDKEELALSLEEYNRVMEPKGLKMISLGQKRNRYLLYVYRPSRLLKDLNQDDSKNLLSELGYCAENCDMCLHQLRNKIETENDFPHEVGLFLGYPYCDVKGFMEHRECLHIGYWKVFDHKEETCALFEKYKRCQEIYGRCYANGIPLKRLIVEDIHH